MGTTTSYYDSFNRKTRPGVVRLTLRHSTKPLIVAGHGIRIANAQEELMRVLDLYYPVVTTFNGFDLVPNDHPSFVGRIGTVGTYGGNYALNNCDLLICIGTRNNIRQVSYNWKSFAPQAKKIIVDIDSAELFKKTVEGEIMRQDAREFLEDFPDIGQDRRWVKSLRTYNLEHDIELTPPYKFIRELTADLPEGAVVVCGNGTACVAMFQAGIVKRGQRIFWNSGCASMGYALPAAIGACFATGKEVICITGDGSIMMNLQELQTIKHYKLPIKIYVLNNNGYRSLELTQLKYFDGDFIGCNKDSGVSFPDFKKLCEVFGVDITVVDIGNEYVFAPKFTDSL